MDEDETQIEQEVETPQAEPGSVMSRLRTLRENFQTEQTIDLDVPGYRGELVARYGPLPWEVIRQLAIRGERGKRDPNNGPMVAADGLANAILGFFYRNDSGVLAPVTKNGDPVTAYDAGLMSVLGIEGTQTTRERVKSVFPDEYALVSHYAALMEWQESRDDGEDEALIAEARSDEAVGPT
jgi:hypothetical protein